MGTQLAEKVYVAIGTDPQEGFATLEWALRKWSSHSISIVVLLLHAPTNIAKDYVYTPLGKLPGNYMSDEKLEGLRKMKEEENEKLLSRYKTFCGKVKAEGLKIEKCNEPLNELLLELISRLRITKLVMGITLMKSSSGKSHVELSRSFHVHHRKPEFCQLFVLSRGKLVFQREENNEGFIEDDQEIMVGRAKEKGILRGWLGKMKHEEKNLCPTASSSTPNQSPDQWENNVEEIGSYFQQLISLNSDEGLEAENETLWNGPNVQENTTAADKVEMLRTEIRNTRSVIELKKKEAKANAARTARAEWAICLCTRRTEELEACINEEITRRVDLKKELDTVEEEVWEVQNEVEGKKSKLYSMLEIQRELSNRLQVSSLARYRFEAELDKAVTERTEMLREIEEWRQQRNVLQRRIEFCKEKDAIGMANRFTELSFDCKEFTAEEVRVATDNFSERLRLKSAGDWTSTYRGRINHTTLAIKLCDSENGLHHEDFLATVKVLSQIRHPNLVAMIGFCSEPKCIVFEYMHNGSLRDALFYGPRSSRTSNLNWHARVQIAAQVCSGLSFLHSARSKPIVHGNLNPSQILLDRNLVAKIHGLRPSWYYQPSVESDIQAFGNLVLQLLTGRNWAGLVDGAIVMDREGLVEVLDDGAGKWPMDLALKLAGIAMRCLSGNDGPSDMDVSMAMAMVKREIDVVRKKAEEIVAGGEREAAAAGGSEDGEDSIDVPRLFICPIFQDVMKNPHLAADGFSYELEAMEEWFRTGHDTSPMTNLKLNHKLLTPNHALRYLIQDWHNKRLCPLLKL
ncbi:hypothetical protein Vadar_007785 [Vaccinium darrowii]|uniref:Uncharacterized protein n=1 Tax=Vaccinium darrowii TaxID=229202 RepID=A0ACB7Z4S4_9ERIC|nr:hypothetical protein Vadar_007785 [Vaccinium darrowii]